MSGEIQARLFEAAEAGDLFAVRAALDAGADINAVRGDPSQESDEQPLMVAAKRGHLPVVELLLQCGAAVNNGYLNSTPALIDALISGRTDLVNLLYRHGALAGLLLGFCFADNHAAIHEILHLQPQRWGEYALDSIRSGNVEMLAENLARNPMITSAMDGPGMIRGAIFQWRLVHNAGPPGQPFDRTRYQAMTRMLLAWGTDPNASNAKGETLLHLCASSGREWSPTDQERADHARILLEHGADPHRTDAAGETPPARADRLHRHALLALFK